MVRDGVSYKTRAEINGQDNKDKEVTQASLVRVSSTNSWCKGSA